MYDPDERNQIADPLIRYAHIKDLSYIRKL